MRCNPFPRLSGMQVIPATVLLIVTVSFSPLFAQDPVMDFIVAADSIYRGSGEEALIRFVGENSVITGAAVHQLIDVAIIVGDQGSDADEKDNIDFARLIAGIYREQTNKSAPFDIVSVYGGWSSEQRSRRARGKELEESSKQARGEQDFATADGAARS